MRLTKHEHAAFTLEADGKLLIVDPGSFTTPFEGLDDVVAVVITHEHPDHWTPGQLNGILKKNPDARIFGPAGVAAAASDFDIVETSDGAEFSVEPFDLKFFGSKHAVIHPSIPVIDNVGVLINDAVCYAGDSFTIPPFEVDILAVPAGAPWLKIAEAMDYVMAVKPRRTFPTHEMVLSAIGKGMSNQRIEYATAQVGGEFFPLEPGEVLEV